jgi:hypothetical protein
MMIEVIMVVFFRIEITDNTSNAIFAGTYQEASVLWIEFEHYSIYRQHYVLPQQS